MVTLIQTTKSLEDMNSQINTTLVMVILFFSNWIILLCHTCIITQTGTEWNGPDLFATFCIHQLSV